MDQGQIIESEEDRAEELVRINCRNPDWQDFLLQTQHTIFHTPLWQEVVSQAYKAESAIYAYYKKGKIRLAVVGFIFDWKICRVFFASLFDGGIVGDTGFMPELISLLTASLKKDKIDKIRIMQTYSAHFSDIPSFKKTEASQHIVKLDSVDENMLWDRLYRNRVRKAVQQARYKGVKIKEVKTKQDIRLLYKLNLQTIKRNHAFSAFTKVILMDFYNKFLRSGQGKAWLAEKDNVCIAGLLVVYSNNASHGMVGGSLDAYFNLRANDLLLHEAMVDTIRNKKHYFDFMLSAKDKKNLQFFKDKFGGEEYPACFYEKNITSIRPVIWEIVWKIIHTPLGGALLRFLYR